MTTPLNHSRELVLMSARQIAEARDGLAKSSTLDAAQEKFRSEPARDTAADYLATLLDYYRSEMIEEKTLLYGVAEVTDWLATP